MEVAARLVDLKKDYVLKSETVHALRGVHVRRPHRRLCFDHGTFGVGQEHPVEPARVP